MKTKHRGPGRPRKVVSSKRSMAMKAAWAKRRSTVTVVSAAALNEALRDQATKAMLQAAIPIRADLLDHAKDLTCNQRNAAYGDPLTNFQIAAELKQTFWRWCALRQNSPAGHALDLVLTKLARIATAPTHEAALLEDTFVDICGYTALAYEVGKRTNGRDAS